MPNIMEQYVDFLKKTFLNYYKIIFEKKLKKEIAQRYIDNYIDVRYSNYLDGINENLSMKKKLTKSIEKEEKKLIKEYGVDFVEEINIYKEIALELYNIDSLYLLESQKRTIEKMVNKRKYFLEEKEGLGEILYNEIKEDITKKKKFLQSFETNTFSLNQKKYDKDNIFLELECNIKFPELYSEKAIEKGKNEEIIREDLTYINFSLGTVKIINDLISCEFDKQYYIEMPASFYTKKQKLNRLLNIIDNEYIMNKLNVLIDFSTFKKYRAYVMEDMRTGIPFALRLDDEFEYSSENTKYLELFNKIIIKKDKYYYNDMRKNGKINNRIIDEVK